MDGVRSRGTAGTRPALPLRNDLSPDDTEAIIWALASPEVHRALRVDCGWPSKRFRHWLRDTLTATVLPDAAA